MLDYDGLRTPQGDGEVLVLPAPHDCARLLKENHAALGAATTSIARRPLSEWRKETRARLLGDPDRPAVVLGHQPEFIHPGVWAKHVVARKIADASGGLAVNLVVDNDTPRSTTLAIPVIQEGRVSLSPIPFLGQFARRIYEELTPLTPHQCASISSEVRQAMLDRFDGSLMPVFLKALAESDSRRHGVSQLVSSRRAVDHEFGINLDEHRVSALDWTPLLIEMVQNPARFAERYNAALAAYRAQRRIRGNQRPMPDMKTGAQGIELPIWAVRRGEPRRRVFVNGSSRRVTLLVEDQTIGDFDLDDHVAWQAFVAPLDESAAWRLRPRALTLTLWARLFLADLFIHGIGGAKYDRICDDIIRTYFHQSPPAFMCVSATLHLDLPHIDKTPDPSFATSHRRRDWMWNPQRHLTASPLQLLRDARRVAVANAEQLRARRASRAERRRAFEAIRQASRAILDQGQDQLRSLEAAVESDRKRLEENRIAKGREYFFAQYSRPALRRLIDALPDTAAFRV